MDLWGKNLVSAVLKFSYIYEVEKKTISKVLTFLNRLKSQQQFPYNVCFRLIHSKYHLIMAEKVNLILTSMIIHTLYF